MTRETHFVTCAPGLEDVLTAELKQLGLGRVQRQIGGARFVGEPRDAVRANLWLRTAVRVLLRLARFEARDADALYRGASAVDWSRFLGPTGSLWVDAQSRDSALDHTRFVEQRVKDAVVDQLRTAAGERPSVRREDPDLRIHVHLSRDRATLSADTSGESLHRRGWRRAQGRAPVAENLAAGLVLLSGWDRRAPLVDPWCGSGTILVEAGLIAAGAAPGLFRERFGFERWPGHDAGDLARQRAEAADARRELPRKWRLYGSDADPERVREARENLAAAGLEDRVTLEVADARSFEPRPGWNAWIVSNLPYGQRVGDGRRVGELYARFGARLREHAVGSHVALLTLPELVGELGKLGAGRPERLRLLNGGIECELLRARL